MRPVRLSLSALSAPVIDAVRLYDPRGARVQIWRRTLSPDTGLQVGVPEPWFKGFCNKAPIPRPEPGGEAVLEMELVSTTRLVAIPNGRRKSDAAQRTRDPDDRFRRYKAIARTIDVPWGEKDGRVSGAMTRAPQRRSSGGEPLLVAAGEHQSCHLVPASAGEGLVGGEAAEVGMGRRQPAGSRFHSLQMHEVDDGVEVVGGD